METTVEVSDHSAVSEVRRLVAELARKQGMSDADSGRAALVATEAATNLVKYGKHGAIAVSAFSEWGTSGVQIIAVDKGPGFANFAASSRDGHSTGGSLGIGLGSIMRASDVFDVYTVQEQGTAVLSRIVKGAVKPVVAIGALLTGSRSAPKPGQIECGDAWSFARKGRWQRLCVVDGLGHGPQAATAAARALEVFQASTERDTPLDILARAHVALKPTRGAVMAVLAIDTEAGSYSFSGVGNIAALFSTGAVTQHLLSVDGVVGYGTRTLRQQDGLWTPDCAAILCSDGLSTRWNLVRYPGLLHRHPALVASVLYRDFARDTDDALCLVAKEMR